MIRFCLLQIFALLEEIGFLLENEIYIESGKSGKEILLYSSECQRD